MNILVKIYYKNGSLNCKLGFINTYFSIYKPIENYQCKCSDENCIQYTNKY